MDAFAALYVSLRNAVLGPHGTTVHAAPAHRGVGHFLTNGRYPVNMLQESSDLFDPAVPLAAGTPLAYGDNPLLNTGKLLIALAIESDVGSPTVTQWIDGALSSLQSLFPFSGSFAGFLWVPKTCATWADALQIAVGSVPRSGAGGQVLVHPEMG